jgi:hypothetical protein
MRRWSASARANGNTSTARSIPPQLFDLEADPHELTNLAADPAHAEASRAGRFPRQMRAALGHGRLRREVRESQARRWVVYEALRNGAYYPWDYQPLQKASERYMRNHMDLNVLSAKITLSMENAMMAKVLAGENPNDVAKEWLKANPDAITPWLAGVTTFDGQDAAAAAKAALAN